ALALERCLHVQPGTDEMEVLRLREVLHRDRVLPRRQNTNGLVSLCHEPEGRAGTDCPEELRQRFGCRRSRSREPHDGEDEQEPDLGHTWASPFASDLLR